MAAPTSQPTGISLPVGHSTFLPNEEPKTRSGFRLGFFLGILVGVIVTLLLAPKTGGETREQVREMSFVLKERAIGLMTGERDSMPDEMTP